MVTITIKQGEGKWIRFTVTQDGVAVDLSTATLRFCVKEKYTDEDYAIEKEDSDFDKTNAVTGIVRVNLSATDTIGLNARNHLCEFMATFVSDTDVDKSATITLTVQRAVIDD